MTAAPRWPAHLGFGVHYDLHATLDDTELGAALTHAGLRDALERARPDRVQCDCKGHPGVASYPTKVGIAAPGIVNDALRIHRDVTREMGLPLVVHYSGIMDAAALARWPDWQRVSADGSRAAGYACVNSPYVSDYMVPQMLEIVEEYDVDGFWVDGDNWAQDVCYCGRCRGLYAAETNAQPPLQASDPGWRDWASFHRRCFERYVAAYTTAVHDRSPECWVCSNWMFSARAPGRVTVPVDLLTGDLEPLWGARRAVCDSRYFDRQCLPWHLMSWSFLSGEAAGGGWHTKTLDHLLQEAAEVVSCGGGYSVYDIPRRDGALIPWVQDLLGGVSGFVRERAALAAGAESVAEVGVLHSEADVNARIPGLYGFIPPAHVAVEGAVTAALAAGLHVDLLRDGDLDGDLRRFRMLIAPEQSALTQPLVDRLMTYARDGGNLVLSGAHLASHANVAGATGIESFGDALDGFHALPVGGEAVVVAGPWARARASAPSTTQWAQLLLADQWTVVEGTSAITVSSVGAGRVVCIHGPIFDAYRRTNYPRLRQLLRTLFAELVPDPIARAWMEGRPAAPLTLTVRRQPSDGAHRLVVHVLNKGAEPATASDLLMVESVPVIEKVRLRVRCSRPPSSVTLVPAQDGAVSQTFESDAVETVIPRLHVHTAVVLQWEMQAEDEAPPWFA